MGGDLFFSTPNQQLALSLKKNTFSDERLKKILKKKYENPQISSNTDGKSRPHYIPLWGS